MNVIERVREIVQSVPDIAAVCNEVHVDFTDDTADSYGLSPTGDLRLKRYVSGGEKRQHTFILYAVWQSLSDYDRMANSGVLLELQQYLEHYTGDVSISTENGTGELTKLTCSNGMLFEIPDENFNAAVRYQLQIAANYNLYEER